MKKMISSLGLLVLIVAMLSGMQKRAEAHCEIPCGIYADSVRIVLIAEHIQTIEKSMKLITELSAEGEKNYNQLIRWTINKEEHAKKIQDIATQYFMFQRVKVSDDEAHMAKNHKMLSKLHELCVYAMKAKQTTDMKYIRKMKDVLHDFSQLYFGKTHHHKH